MCDVSDVPHSDKLFHSIDKNNNGYTRHEHWRLGTCKLSMHTKLHSLFTRSHQCQVALNVTGAFGGQSLIVYTYTYMYVCVYVIRVMCVCVCVRGRESSFFWILHLPLNGKGKRHFH